MTVEELGRCGSQKRANASVFAREGRGQEPDSSFPARLRSLRERRRISGHSLSEQCGLSRNMIGMYERGEKEPSLSSLVEIADFFDVSVDYLLGRQNFF